MIKKLKGSVRKFAQNENNPNLESVKIKKFISLVGHNNAEVWLDFDPMLRFEEFQTLFYAKESNAPVVIQYNEVTNMIMDVGFLHEESNKS